MFESQENPQSQPNFSTDRPRRSVHASMVNASFVCAIIGIITVFTGVFSLIFGSLAIIFSALSKGEQPRRLKKAKYGLIVGTIAVVLGLTTTATTFAALINTYGGLNSFYEEYVNEFYGLDLDSL